jgi:hypothetical protein
MNLSIAYRHPDPQVAALEFLQTGFPLALDPPKTRIRPADQGKISYIESMQGLVYTGLTTEMTSDNLWELFVQRSYLALAVKHKIPLASLNQKLIDNTNAEGLA